MECVPLRTPYDNSNIIRTKKLLLLLIIAKLQTVSNDNDNDTNNDCARLLSKHLTLQAISHNLLGPSSPRQSPSYIYIQSRFPKGGSYKGLLEGLFRGMPGVQIIAHMVVRMVIGY